MNGNNLKYALPIIKSLGRVPQTRESELFGRLSPITKYWSDPKEDGFAKVASSVSKDLKSSQVQATAATDAIATANTVRDNTIAKANQALDEVKRVEGAKLETAKSAIQRATALNTKLSILGLIPAEEQVALSS